MIMRYMIDLLQRLIYGPNRDGDGIPDVLQVKKRREHFRRFGTEKWLYPATYFEWQTCKSTASLNFINTFFKNFF